jgi:hypothetical protein
MSQGFIAYNNASQVLVSSDTRNLHFVQKISGPDEVVYSSDNYGGMRRWRYRASCSVTPLPFITFPTSDYYAVSRITNQGGGQWDIEVIRSGASSSTPEMYIFSDPRASTATDSHGMIVYRDDGSPSFDSRLRPLAITGGFAVTHPSNPKPSFPYGLSARYCESDAGGVFAPDQFNSYTLANQPAKPMFFFASLAQAEREGTYYASDSDCLGFDKFGLCLTRTVYNWRSTYWAFYRGGVSFSGTTLNAGWIVVQFGCNYRYSQDDSLIGIGIGGSSGGGGSWAYSNETLNLSSASVIAGDASRYD